jgi:hypothetical protein
MIKLYYYTNDNVAEFKFAGNAILSALDLAQYKVLKAQSLGVSAVSSLSNIAIRELTLSAAAEIYKRKVTLEVQESDTSYRYRSLMAKPQLVLKFSLPEYIEFPIGTWCDYEGERYTLNQSQNIKKNGTRNIEYTLTMGGEEDKMSIFKMRNTIDHRLKWSMCAKPREFVEEIVKNLNERMGENVWSVGTCIEHTEKTVEFNHTYIDAALQSVADAFETEWEIVNHTISLHKVEYFKDIPLPLSYGKGNGFVPGVGRTTASNEQPIKRLYIQGGERNIDRSKYGSAELLLPKGQTYDYEGRTYKADADGYYIERIDKVSDAVKEDSLDCSETYPSRVGKVSSVEVVNAAKNFYDIIDNTIPDALNFNDYLIKGSNMTIIFQSGMLASKEFELKYKHAERRFEIVPQEIDGVTMPNDTWKPQVGDTYAVFGCMLPDAYICDNTTKTGASWDMFKEGVKYLYEHEDQKFTFTGTLQGLYAKRNWSNIGGRLKVGSYIHFSDEQFAKDGIDIRITGVKDFLNTPHSPTLELSNSVSGKSVSSQLQKVDNQEVVIDNTKKSIIEYTKRRFRDTKETVEMLNNSLLNFSKSVNPITVQTMAALVGDESLQFRFIKSKEDFTPTDLPVSYDKATKQLIVSAPSYLQHMTLGINAISSNHANTDYKVWQINPYTSAVLDDASKKYYLYAKVSQDTAIVGDFLLSETAIDMMADSGYYYLLVGILNSEMDGERSYVSLYGFTEILPGRITTDKIVSADGLNYIDLVNNTMALGKSLKYINGTLYLDFLFSNGANIGGWIFDSGVLKSQDGACILDGINGLILANGFLRKQMLHINSKNIAKYTHSIDDIRTIDYFTAGALLTIDYIEEQICYFPSIITGTESTQKKDYARSFIGQAIVIYNNSGNEIGVSGALKTPDKDDFVSPILRNRHYLFAQCKIRTTTDGIEQVYWEYFTGGY